MLSENEVLALLSNSGFTSILSTQNCQRAAQYIMLNDVVLKRKASLDQLRDGLNTPFKLADYLQKNPSVNAASVFPTPEDVKLAPHEIVQKLKTDEAVLSEKKQQVCDWFIQFILHMPEKHGK